MTSFRTIEEVKESLNNLKVKRSWTKERFKEEVEEMIKKLKSEETLIIDVLDGLTDLQKDLVKALVDKGYSPMALSVDVENDRIYYFGKLIWGVETK